MEKKPGLWKKGDRVILGGSILLCLASFLWILPFSSPQQVTITVGGQIYGRYLITQNQVIHIRQQTGAYNCVEIENGGVSMTQASCQDHTCVHQGILRRGGAIICLPNQVVILVESETQETPDAIVGRKEEVLNV